MSLLELPTELLDQVFSYLDWDRSQCLEPTKEDIVNASLTCKLLRKVLAPLVFRDVTLRLRWVNKDLVEPLLYKLRRERPTLAEHIRCVHIRAEYEPCLHCAQRDDPPTFAVPSGIADWLNPSGSSSSAQGQVYRSHVNTLAEKILNPVFAQVNKPPSDSAEDAILSFKRRNNHNSDLDALAIVMLCIPASTNSLVFNLPDNGSTTAMCALMSTMRRPLFPAYLRGVKTLMCYSSLTDNYAHESKNNFAVRVLATALDLHRHRIQRLTMISNAAAGRLTISRQALARLGTGGGEQDAIAPDVLRDLKVDQLVIAISDHHTAQRAAQPDLHQNYRRWHHMSHCVRKLELRYLNANISDMVQFIKGFQQLKTVRAEDCALSLPHRPGMQRDRREELEASIWLAFAIDLRRRMQHVKIELSKLHRRSIFDPLPECTTRWIVSQAVPAGCLIDADREERLLLDYASFAGLWEAEHGERGAQARGAWATLRGKLSDDAMSRRWR